jgi:exodeoxyribonuclease V alpha subunit
MSIHKSQGSEFKKVFMCIPPERSPILTRELIYTGLTRAKSQAVVIGSAEVLKSSLMAKVERGGQLSARVEELLS